MATHNISKELNCSDDTALRTMKTFEILGIVKIQSLEDHEGRPLNYVEIAPEFAELLNTHGRNNAGNYKTQEKGGESDAYDTIKPEDFVQRTIRTQHPKDAENSKTQEKPPVSVSYFTFKSGFERLAAEFGDVTTTHLYSEWPEQWHNHIDALIKKALDEEFIRYYPPKNAYRTNKNEAE